MKKRMRLKMTPINNLPCIVNFNFGKIRKPKQLVCPEFYFNSENYNAYNSRHMKFIIKVDPTIFNTLRQISKDLKSDWLQHGKRQFGFSNNNQLVCLW